MQLLGGRRFRITRLGLQAAGLRSPRVCRPQRNARGWGKQQQQQKKKRRHLQPPAHHPAACNPKLKHVHNDVNNAGLRPQLSITRYCHKIDCYMMNRRPPRPLPLDCSMQVYLLHYIVLVLFDHWMFGSRGVSTNRPEVVGSLLLLIIPLTLLIAYPFYMYVAMSAGRSNVTPGRLSLSFCSLPLATIRFFVNRDTAAYLILS